MRICSGTQKKTLAPSVVELTRRWRNGGAYWTSGAKHVPSKAQRLPKIALERLTNRVRILPKIFKIKLVEIMQQAEEEGRWPENLRYSTVTNTPKAKAVHEGQLRRKGLLPMNDRIWMSARKPTGL